jgi:hypothetical protein
LKANFINQSGQLDFFLPAASFDQPSSESLATLETACSGKLASPYDVNAQLEVTHSRNKQEASTDASRLTVRAGTSGQVIASLADSVTDSLVQAFLNSPTLQVTKLDTRHTDLVLTGATVPLIQRNDAKIYEALVRLSEHLGEPINQYVRRVQVGYGRLKPESGCNPRALERAFPRLAPLNYVLISPPAHSGTHAHT